MGFTDRFRSADWRREQAAREQEAALEKRHNELLNQRLQSMGNRFAADERIAVAIETKEESELSTIIAAISALAASADPIEEKINKIAQNLAKIHATYLSSMGKKIRGEFDSAISAVVASLHFDEIDVAKIRTKLAEMENQLIPYVYKADRDALKVVEDFKRDFKKLSKGKPMPSDHLGQIATLIHEAINLNQLENQRIEQFEEMEVLLQTEIEEIKNDITRAARALNESDEFGVAVSSMGSAKGRIHNLKRKFSDEIQWEASIKHILDRKRDLASKIPAIVDAALTEIRAAETAASRSALAPAVPGAPPVAGGSP